jgi:GNAT superfamily N-acetyltransferase
VTVERTALRFAISNLADKLEFIPVIADRVWHQWWQTSGHDLGFLENEIRKTVARSDYQGGFVAHTNGCYCGSCFVIDDDFEFRPDLEPWIAAVFVEPDFRKMGIGQALVEQAANHIFNHAFPRAYLNATPSNAPFYERFGWQRLEEVKGMIVLSFAAASNPQTRPNL